MNYANDVESGTPNLDYSVLAIVERCILVLTKRSVKLTLIFNIPVLKVEIMKTIERSLLSCLKLLMI